jgi:hypothetical protein
VLTLIENITVTGQGVRIGDAVLIGGDHHEVVDLRTLPGFRKMLVFAEDSAFLLPTDSLITVTRTRTRTSQVPRWPGRLRKGR